jgi:hypothetical protein
MVLRKSKWARDTNAIPIRRAGTSVPARLIGMAFGDIILFYLPALGP